MHILSPAVTLFVALASCAAAGAQTPWLLPNFADRIELQISNPNNESVRNVVTLRVRDIKTKAPGFPGTFALAMRPGDGGKFIPMQADDLDSDGLPDEISLLVDAPTHASVPVEVYYSSTLHDIAPWPQLVHASTAYGYNRATAAIESMRIGYRVYGGFLFDVQAHRDGKLGLFNAMLGYSRTGSPPIEGRDIVHYGQTLGLGGLFLRQGETIYRPPFNTPTYTHKQPSQEEPTYRVVADGPIRAVVVAELPAWHAGPSVLAVRGTYEMDVDDEIIRATVRVTATHLNGQLQVGAGVTTLPNGSWQQTADTVIVRGTQDAAVGELALGLGVAPARARGSSVLHTPDGENRAIEFGTLTRSGESVEFKYTMAASWSGSGVTQPLEHLQTLLHTAANTLQVTAVRHSTTPHPRALEGEPQ